jgi:hypothetical protein
VSPAFPDSTFLLGSVLRRGLLAPYTLGVKGHAPAAAPYTVVELDQSREVGPARFIQRSHTKARHDLPRSLTRIGGGHERASFDTPEDCHKSLATHQRETSAIRICNAWPAAETNALMITTRVRRLTALAVAAAFIAPSVASAQPLNSVAIVNPNTYLALDVAGVSTALGAKVIMWYGNWGSNQRWNLVTRSDGKQQIVNQKSGMCLTTNGIAGSQLYQWTCNDGPRQEWAGDLQSYLGDIPKLSNPSTGLVLDAQGGNRSAGTAVIGWYDTPRSSNQQFQYLQLY